MKKLVALVVGISFVGCGTARFKSKMDAWVGRNINDVVMQYGPPVNTFKMPGTENQMYTFHFSGPTRSTASNGYPGQVNIETNETTCNVSFVVNSANLVETWRSSGNACRAKLFNSAF